jgi:hypothetical protein
VEEGMVERQVAVGVEGPRAAWMRLEQRAYHGLRTARLASEVKW